MRIPPGMTSAAFTRALEQFEKIVGKEWVFSSDEDMALYKDAYTPFRGEPELERWASAAVAPTTTEEVQAIVKVANDLKVPLYAVSTGRNLGYGGVAPVYSGSVVVDLKRMNKIVEVNEELGTCVVEPGVSYFELYKYIQDRGLKVMICPAQPGWGSLVGNALDHGCGESMLRDHFDAILCMEVVLPTGEVMRTGVAANPKNTEWQFKYGFGPHISGMFSQSNFGIVTRVSMRLVRMPEVARIVNVNFTRFEDLDPIINTLHELYDGGALNTNAGIGSPLMGNRTDKDVIARYNDFGNTPASEWNRLQQDRKVPMYSLALRFFAAEKIAQAHIDYAKEKFGAIAGCTFTDDRSYKLPVKDPYAMRATDRQVIGIPTLQTFTQLTNGTWNGHFFFAPAIPMTAHDLIQANTVFSRVAKENDCYNGFSSGVCFFPKTFISTYGFYINENVEENRKKRRCVERLIEESAKYGYVEYRTPPAFQDWVMNETYSWNDNALRRFHERIKDTLDPNGILALGKSGIWPKRMRNQPRKA